MWNPVSEAAAWAGGTHEAGLETASYDLSWFYQQSVKMSGQGGHLPVVWWVGKRKESGGGPGCEEVAVPSKEEHVPDHIRVAKTSLSLL